MAPPELLVARSQVYPVPLPPEAVKVWLAPTATVTREGETASAAVAVLIVTLTVVGCVPYAPVPVTVSGYVPGAAVPPLIVRVELPPEVRGLGLNDPDAPLGTPLIDRDTLWALPDVTAVLIALVPEAPWATVKLVGLAEIEKSLAANDVETMAVGENALESSVSVVLS